MLKYSVYIMRRGENKRYPFLHEEEVFGFTTEDDLDMLNYLVLNKLDGYIFNNEELKPVYFVFDSRIYEASEIDDSL